MPATDPTLAAQVAVWEEHLRAEFAIGSWADALACMDEDACVNHVPVGAGGRGKAELAVFYRDFFIPQLPADFETRLLARTVAPGCIVDELYLRFTHSLTMDWLLPGVAPVGQRVEMAVVVVATFRAGKLLTEHLYWDQASVLVQLGLIAPGGLPVLGVEAARAVADPAVPLNPLLGRAAA